MKKTRITMLTECAVMVALAFALSYAKVWEMPLGGSVTIGSMLPIMLIGIKYGTLVGLATGFVYSGTQAVQALIAGNVFPYCQTWQTLLICIFFDYVIPFTVLGLAGVFKRVIKNREIGAYVGILSVTAVRFLCHLISGVAIWGQWAPEGMGKFVYSLAYNGSFLGADLAICLLLAVLMLRKSEIRKLIWLDR